MYQDDVGRSANPNSPTTNQYQLHSERVIAEQAITHALEGYAKGLPNGLFYLQEAINGMGDVLDRLEMRTGQHLDPAVSDTNTPRFNQFADVEAEVAGAEESADIKDYNSAGGA